MSPLTELLRLPVEARRRSVQPAILVLVAALVATFVTAWASRQDDEAQARAEFDALADKLTVVVSETMNAYEQTLRGGVGLFDAFGSVSRSAWATYVESLQLQANYPGVQGIGYAVVVDPKRIDAFETGVRGEGLNGYTVYPKGEGERDLTTATLFLEPLDWRNRRALGYDMFSDPVRREAMARARDTGETALSRSVTLRQETDEDVQRGILLYAPVYQQGSLNTTVEDRRRHLTGFVYSAFRTRDLMTAILKRAARVGAGMANVALYDGAREEAGNLLFASQGADVSPAAHFHATMPVTVHGARWTLKFSSSEAFEAAAAARRPTLVLIIGSVLGLLTAAIIGLLSLGRETARLAAQRLAKEAAERAEAEQQARLATRELAHRVKNSLSVVAAIATQTIRCSSSLQDFDAAFKARLRGLATVHDLLASGGSYGTDLTILAGDVLRPYQGDRPDHLRIAGPPVPLAPQSAVLLSIVLNELATNATKYGAWSTPAGRVALVWTLDNGGTGRVLELSWVERGGKPAQPPTRTGFGSNVIQFAIERSMKGKVKSEFGEQGVAYWFEIPLTALGRDADETTPAAAAAKGALASN